jgi:DNA-binding NtrC family response regulator
VKEGTFREDLYYRLNVIPLRLPPLRSRIDDMPLLAQHFLQKACEANHIAPRSIGQDTMRALMSYDWPGNIRQLENALEFAVAMSGQHREIVLTMLPDEVRRPERSGLLHPVVIPDEGLNFASVVSQLERDLILGCLEKTGGNKRQAARLLPLSRTTLIDKLQRLNLETPAA